MSKVRKRRAVLEGAGMYRMNRQMRHRQITARISRHLAANTARADIPCTVTSVTQCDANERVGEAGGFGALG